MFQVLFFFFKAPSQFSKLYQHPYLTVWFLQYVVSEAKENSLSQVAQFGDKQQVAVSHGLRNQVLKFITRNSNKEMRL